MKALEDSIKHWERLASGRRKLGEDIRASHCALCNKFAVNSLNVCEGCPVYRRTNLAGCEDTPYWDCHNAAEWRGLDSAEFKSAAKEMLKFLRSLRKDVK